jgi:selenocysteine lyase/cysteine desulfurase
MQLYCGQSLENRLPLPRCNIKGMDPEQVSATLDGDFGIASRAGLHCAPLVHQDLGIHPLGGVRFSPGCFNTLEKIDQVVVAMASISRF